MQMNAASLANIHDGFTMFKTVSGPEV